MREVVRRIVAAVCLYTGIALCLTHVGSLYRIGPVDWNRKVYDRQQHAGNVSQMMAGYVGSEMLKDVDLASETRGKLDDYIAHETEGRLIVVSGPEWEGLWNDISATVQGNAPSSAWAGRRGVEAHERYVYLPTGSGPLGQLTGDWPQDYLQAYVRIDPVSQERNPRYLNVDMADQSDIRDGAPTHITYPYRTYGAVILLGGLLFYILVPRRIRPETGMFYQARAAGWIPDLLAAFCSGAFFGMPFLITGDAKGGPLSSALWPVTVVLWGMAGGFAVIFVITAWYQTRCVRWDDDGITVETWGGPPKYIRADELETVGPYMLEAPRWLRTLAWIIAIFNWRGGSSAMLLERPDPGFVITTKAGRSFRFTGDGLCGADSLLKWLIAHHVSVDNDACELMKTKSDYEPGKAGFVVGLIFAVLAVGGVAPPLVTVAANAMPQPEPEYRAGSFEATSEFTRPIPKQSHVATAPDTSQADDDEPQVPVTPQMLAREQQIMQEIRQLNEHLKTLRSQIGTVSNPNAVAIDETQKAMQRLKELQDEFDAVRKGKASAEEPAGDASTPPSPRLVPSIPNH